MKLRRVTVWVGPQDWATIKRLAAVRTVEEDERVTASELVRRGIAREIQAVRGLDGQPRYKKP